MAGQNEIFGIASEQAQVIAGGAVGAGIRLYLRPAGQIARNVCMVGLSIAAASAFEPDVRPWIGLNIAATGGLIALVSLGVAEGILRAVEKFDFAALIRRK